MTTVFPFPVQPITARRQLREAVVAALKRAQLAVGITPVSVDSPGDWPYPQGSLPAVCVRSATDSKTSLTKGNTDFTTTVEVDVRAAVAATTGEAAQNGIEALWFQVERAVLLDFSVLQLVQAVPTVESSIDIKAEGQVHIGGALGRFRFETFETFDISVPAGTLRSPSVAEPIATLTQVTVDVATQGAPQPDDLGLIIKLKGA